MLQTAFFGSSSYVIPILEALRTSTDLRLIVTQPDKPQGRKHLLTPSPPQVWALAHNIEVLKPNYLPAEKDQVMQALKKHSINLAVVADYGQLIPRDIFDLPKWKTLNIHFSKLPDLRGASPVQWTILRGDKEAWITFFLIAEELDAGQILFQHCVPLDGRETTEQLYIRLFQVTSNLLPEVLKKYSSNQLTPWQQDSSKATFTRRLTRIDGFVTLEVLQFALTGKSHPHFKPDFIPTSNFHPSADGPTPRIIQRMLQAFTPWPGVWTLIRIKNSESSIKELRLKLLKIHIEEPRLVIDEVQLEGKNPTTWKEFVQRYQTTII